MPKPNIYRGWSVERIVRHARIPIDLTGIETMSVDELRDWVTTYQLTRRQAAACRVIWVRKRNVASAARTRLKQKELLASLERQVAETTLRKEATRAENAELERLQEQCNEVLKDLETQILTGKGLSLEAFEVKWDGQDMVIAGRAQRRNRVLAESELQAEATMPTGKEEEALSERAELMGLSERELQETLEDLKDIDPDVFEIVFD